MNRHSEIVTVGAVSIETYVDGDGPDVVVLSSYGRDGGDDFEPFTAALVSAGYRVLRPQPLVDDIAHVIDHLAGGPAAVLGHPFGNFVARAVAANHPEHVAAVMLAAAQGRTVPPAINSATSTVIQDARHAPFPEQPAGGAGAVNDYLGALPRT